MKPTMTTDHPPSLTRREAAERAGLIAVKRYDIDADFTALLNGTEFRAVSTIEFTCRAPGATTFVDACVEVVSATLNGAALPREAISNGRITLANLRAENTLVVESVQPETSAEWVHRSIDPADGEVYVWTSFEPDDARRAWACFDQPDLKAPHGFSVLAPERWKVFSNSGDPRVEPAAGGARRWVFPDTPPLSTYVPALSAGNFFELRSQRGGYDLGLQARQSLARFLERDAEEIFEVTAQGLAFFGEQFGLAFPQHKYDQVFEPDMGGAMENYGCVLFSDVFLYRSEPTYVEREKRALIILHEMAHMWFGDMVTMRWWEDLWLNEAFAEWACHWAAEAATKFTDAWSGFLVSGKVWGYAADMAPTTHPIRQQVADVAAAAAGFDGITYPKGASVLKQLYSYVGAEAFLAGLQAYFKKHAWGNTELTDLMDELSSASGRDLREWTRGWLDTPGTDRLEVENRDGGTVLKASGPDGEPPRPHRLVIGIYERDGVQLFRSQALSIETSGAETLVEGIGDEAVVVVNDDDLTFASVRPPAESLEAMLTSASRLPTAVGRALAFTTAWDMLSQGELRTADFLHCIEDVLRTERLQSLVEPAFELAVEAADLWSPDAERETLMSELADLALEVAADPMRRRAALRALAQAAVTDEHFSRLTEAAREDIDLAWRSLVRRAAVAGVDASEITALQERDPDPDSWVRALAVNAAHESAAGKGAAWKAAVEDHRVPAGSVRNVGRAFWQRPQSDLLKPYTERFLAMLPSLHALGMIPALAITGTMFPRSLGDQAFVERAVAAAKQPEVSPIIRRIVVEQCDRLSRRIRARGL